MKKQIKSYYRKINGKRKLVKAHKRNCRNQNKTKEEYGKFGRVY